ncbi:MAG: C40 family peptidase [Bacteroidaceae bacterium]
MHQYIQKAEDKLGMSIDKKDYFPLYLEVADWLGTPYRYGGTSKNGVDCSGFTCAIFQKAYDRKLPRNSKQQYELSKRKIKKRALKEGDLVFFSAKNAQNTVSHVGVYLKEGRFAHASTSRGVIISSLYENYWQQNWVCGGRTR